MSLEQSCFVWLSYDRLLEFEFFDIYNITVLLHNRPEVEKLTSSDDGINDDKHRRRMYLMFTSLVQLMSKIICISYRSTMLRSNLL